MTAGLSFLPVFIREIYDVLVFVHLCCLSGIFALNNQTGALSVVKALDYESAAQHTLNISASDIGQPPHKAFSDVTVQVIDANDNSPALEARIIRASVLEVTSCFDHNRPIPID